MTSPTVDLWAPAWDPEQERQVCAFFLQRLASCLALYLFGSQAQRTADCESDIDLAVLVEGYAGSEQLWQLSCELSEQTHRQVDLIDLRAASTVMQYQVLSRGRRIWQRDSRAAVYEAFILSEKTALDEARQGLINDIRKSGHVYRR
jgi:predicted nucleotidyltransferase